MNGTTGGNVSGLGSESDGGVMGGLEFGEKDDVEFDIGECGRDTELVQTPLDPEELVLNPGGEETSKNPLCPYCEEEITPVSSDMERRFVCGCETNWEFRFGE